MVGCSITLSEQAEQANIYLQFMEMWQPKCVRNSTHKSMLSVPSEHYCQHDYKFNEMRGARIPSLPLTTTISLFPLLPWLGFWVGLVGTVVPWGS